MILYVNKFQSYTTDLKILGKPLADSNRLTTPIIFLI